MKQRVLHWFCRVDTAICTASYLFFHNSCPVRERIVRAYIVLICLAATLAELDTPFARNHFRALQKWWAKAPLYLL